jgi:hypothetical protein
MDRWLIGAVIACLLGCCNRGPSPGVDGSQTAAAIRAPTLQALGGWFGPEVIRGAPARWFSESAEMSIDVPEPGKYRLSFWLDPLAGVHTARVESNGQTRRIRIDGSTLVAVDFDLPAGKSSVRFTAVEKCSRPIDATKGQNKDSRCLALMVRAPMVVKEAPLTF